MTTPNIGLELPARGASGWDATINENFSRIDGAFGGLGSLWADIPEAYTLTGTFNGTTGTTLPLPKTVSSTSDYAVAVTPKGSPGTVGVVSVEKGLSSFTVKCSGGDTTTAFDAVVWFTGDAAPQGVKVQGRTYPSIGVSDHSNPATPGSLAALIASIGSTPAIIEFIGNTIYQITGADLTVPQNVALRFQPGAVLSVASGRTVTLTGVPIEAGPWQIFSGAGNIAGLREARPEWFGANPMDDAVDDTEALQKAFSSLADTAGIVHLSPGKYRLTGTVTIAKNGWTLKGVARAGKTFASGAGYQASYIKIAGNITGPAIEIAAYGSYPSRGWTISDLSFEGDPTTRPTCDAVIKVTSGDQGTIRDIDFQDIAGRAIWTIRCVKTAFRNIDVYTCGDTGKPALDFNYSGSNITQGCHISDLRVESCINAPYINIASAQQLHFTNLGFEASPSVTGSGQSFMVIGGSNHVITNIHMNQNAGTSPRIDITGSYNTISGIASSGTHGASDIRINGGSYNVISAGSFVASGAGEDIYAVTITGAAWYNRISDVIFRSIGGLFSDSTGSGNILDGATQYQGRMALVTSSANVTQVLNCYTDGLAQTTGAPAISLTGSYTGVKNCYVRSSTTATAAISVTGSNPAVRDNDIYNLSASGAVGIKVGGNYASVTGNLITTINSHGIQVGDETSAAVPIMTISGNSISGVGASAYAIALMAASDVTDGGVISGNRIRGTGAKSIYITDNGSGAPRYKNFSIFGNNIYNGPALSIPSAGPNAANFDALGYGSVASAATVTLPDTSNTINVTGTTGITSITASWRGRVVTLIFAGALTVTDGGNLKLAGNLSTGANTTLTLVCDGANWYEIARSVN